MITRITGIVNRVLDDEIRLQVGALEYQVLVPDFVRRELQTHTGEEVTLHTTEFLEGNQVGNRFVPRLIGFRTEAEQEFFELFCTVDKIGAKKALKAMVRPVRDIAEAIGRDDKKWLTTLPGVGAGTADQIVTTLKKKVARFTLGLPEGAAGAKSGTHGNLLEDVYNALMALGHNPVEARSRLDQLLIANKPFTSVEEALGLIYSRSA